MTLEEKITQAAKKLESSHQAIVLTGSLLAKEAGIPNFRQAQLSGCGCSDHQGQDCNHHCSENCHHQGQAEDFTLENLKEHPQNIYRICFALLQSISQAQPTSGYRILTHLEQMNIVKRLITENVDSLHQVAGTQKILEIYGNMRGAVCLQCRQRLGVADLVAKIQQQEMPPKCPQCSGVLKPSITFNDEKLPPDFTIAQEELAKADLLLAIGSDLQIPASRYLANKATRLIIINSQPTPFDGKAEIVINGNLNEILDLLWEKVQEELGLI